MKNGDGRAFGVVPSNWPSTARSPGNPRAPSCGLNFPSGPPSPPSGCRNPRPSILDPLLCLFLPFPPSHCNRPPPHRLLRPFILSILLILSSFPSQKPPKNPTFQPLVLQPHPTQSNVAPAKLAGTRVKVPPVELDCSRRNTTSTAPP